MWTVDGYRWIIKDVNVLLLIIIMFSGGARHVLCPRAPLPHPTCRMSCERTKRRFLVVATRDKITHDAGGNDLAWKLKAGEAATILEVPCD